MTTTTETFHKSTDAKRPRMADAGAAPCTRCAGQGGSQHWPNFTCYRCFGMGIDPKRRLKVREFPASWSDERCAEWEAEKARKDEEREAAKQAKAEAEAAAVFAGNVARCPSLADESLRGNPFIADLFSKAHRYDLTDKQVAAVERVAAKAAEAAERDAALDAAGVAVPRTVDRIDVEGTVRSVKFVENQYGGSLKMLVEHDTGWKVWGTVPGSLDYPEVGDRVAFVARVEPSTDDKRFGFFSRPTKARVLAAAG